MGVSVSEACEALSQSLQGHWGLLAVAFAGCVVLTGTVAALARALGAVAPVRADRWHDRPVALHGGVAMMIVAIAVAVASPLGWLPARPGEGLPIEATPVAWVLLASLGAGFAGLADDLLRFRPATKLALLFAAATIAIVGLGFGRVTGITWVDVPLTYAWFLLVANAVNMLDNMDGIAAGATTAAAVGTAAVAAVLGDGDVALMALATAALAAGFLVWNRPRARIFMGDSGSLFLGTMLAGLTALAAGWMGPAAGPTCDCLVQSMSPLALSVLLLAFPLADTAFVSVTRSARGQSPMVGGRDHTTHRVATLAAMVRWSRTRTWLLAIAAMAAGPLSAMAVLPWRDESVPVVAAAVLAVLAVLAGQSLDRAVPIRSDSDALVPGTASDVARTIMARASDGISSLRRELLDAVLVGLCAFAGYAIRFGLPLPPDSAMVLRRLLPVTIAACLLANAAIGVYEPAGHAPSRWRAILSRTGSAAALGFLAAIGLLVLLDWLPVGFSRAAWGSGLLAWIVVLGIRSARAAAREP